MNNVYLSVKFKTAKKHRRRRNQKIFGFIVLRGKCSYCNNKISLFYPLSEIFFLLIGLINLYIYGISIFLIFNLILIFLFYILFFMDLRFYRLPLTINIMLVAFGFARLPDCI